MRRAFDAPRHCLPKLVGYTFTVRLTLDASAKPFAQHLVETIGAAIDASDACNRLLPGMPLPPRGYRVLAQSVTLAGYEESVIEPGNDPQAAQALSAQGERIKELGAIIGRLFETSDEIERHVEALRDAQASLFEVYDDLLFCDAKAVLSLTRKLQARLDRVTDLLAMQARRADAAG